METSLHDRIQERAYELWNADGRVKGHAEQHWLAAERQVLREMATQLPAADKPARERGALPKVAAQRSKTASPKPVLVVNR